MSKIRGSLSEYLMFGGSYLLMHIAIPLMLVAWTPFSPWIPSRVLASLVVGSAPLMGTGFNIDFVMLSLVVTLPYYALICYSILKLKRVLNITLFQAAFPMGLISYVISVYGLSIFFPALAHLKGAYILAANLIFSISFCMLHTWLKKRKVFELEGIKIKTRIKQTA